MHVWGMRALSVGLRSAACAHRLYIGERRSQEGLLAGRSCCGLLFASVCGGIAPFGPYSLPCRSKALRSSCS